MRVTRANLIFASLIAAFIRLFVFPLDDYPDIYYVYRRMIEYKLYFNVANFVDLTDLFKSYSCAVLTPKNPVMFSSSIVFITNSGLKSSIISA